jgi:hypothetical protein
MFDYLLNTRQFTIQLGKFISHKVISYLDRQQGRIYRSAEELNALDRYELTEEFLQSLRPGLLDGSIPLEDVRDDIAMYIDKMIPKAFVKYRDHLDIAPSKVQDDAILQTDLIYHFRENRKY